MNSPSPMSRSTCVDGEDVAGEELAHAIEGDAAHRALLPSLAGRPRRDRRRVDGEAEPVVARAAPRPRSAAGVAHGHGAGQLGHRGGGEPLGRVGEHAPVRTTRGPPAPARAAPRRRGACVPSTRPASATIACATASPSSARVEHAPGRSRSASASARPPRRVNSCSRRSRRRRRSSANARSESAVAGPSRARRGRRRSGRERAMWRPPAPSGQKPRWNTRRRRCARRPRCRCRDDRDPDPVRRARTQRARARR